MERAVFLDRDGTLIEDRGYICTFGEVRVFPFAVAAVRMLNESRYRVIVVTNQSSIARGICTEAQVQGLHEEITAHFRHQGAVISGFYYSPYLKDGQVEKYKKDHPSRKPGPGMILEARRDFGIDLSVSYIIGDSARDILAGKQAGCQTVLVKTGHGGKAIGELKQLNVTPDIVAENLLAAVEMIV